MIKNTTKFNKILAQENFRLRWAFVFLFVIIFQLSASAQNEEYSFKDRLFYGGSFGLAIGNYTNIELAPHVGYYITPRWAVGLSLRYSYLNYKYRFQISYTEFARAETHVFGSSIFTNYVYVHNVNDFLPIGLNMRLFAHAEFEVLSYNKSFFQYNEPGRTQTFSFLLGPGFRLPIGERSSVNLMILWNLNPKLNDFYGSRPIFRVGYNF